MSDDAFHLTPLDVRRYDFGAKLRGYDPARVEEFRARVAEELERLTRAHQELEAKARGFHEQLRAFRERDKALNDALVSAQQLRSEMRSQAEREAELLLREARAEAERIVEGARGQIHQVEAELVFLERSRQGFVRQMRSLVERQLAELAAVEAALPPLPATPEGEPPRGVSVKTPAWLESLVKE